MSVRSGRVAAFVPLVPFVPLWLLGLLGLTALACGAAPLRETTDEAPAIVAMERLYELRFFGELVGTAREVERRDVDEVTLLRSEHVVARRGEERLSMTAAVTVTGRVGQPRVVEVALARCASSSRHADPFAPSGGCDAGQEERYAGRAERAAGGWRVVDESGERWLPADAIPAEWGALEAPRQATTVFFPASRFALGAVEVRDREATRWAAKIAVGQAVIDVVTELDASERARLVSSSDGLSAARVDVLPRRWPLADLVAQSSLPIDGERARDERVARLAVELPEGTSPPTIELAGQRVEKSGGRWLLTLTQEPAGDDTQAIASLARAVAQDVVDDRRVAAPADCTVYALRFVHSARQRGIAARLVTGYAIDGPRLVRHRWAQARTGGRWVSVDPSTGEAPAPPRLWALQVHGDSAEDLVGAAASYGPLRDARVRWRAASEP